MTYRQGENVYADETAAYMHFISISSRETWGTMTMAEWRTAPNNQMVSWDQWCAKHRPSTAHGEARMSIDDQKPATMLHVDWRASQAGALLEAAEVEDKTDEQYAEHVRTLTIQAALAHIQDAAGKYLDPGYPMTADEFIDVVLSAADDQEVVRAMRGLGK